MQCVQQFIACLPLPFVKKRAFQTANFVDALKHVARATEIHTFLLTKLPKNRVIIPKLAPAVRGNLAGLLLLLLGSTGWVYSQ
jgi:hypothetical protein